MTPKHFEIKTTYERARENGLNTKVNEVFLMDDYTFKGVEERITEELAPMVTGEFNISKIEVKDYSEIINTEDDNADRWFKCKIAMILLNEVTAKEKKTNLLYLVKAGSAEDVIKRTHQYLESCVCDYEIALVTESPIVDFFAYEQRELAE
jgi:hypothetical protein